MSLTEATRIHIYTTNAEPLTHHNIGKPIGEEMFVDIPPRQLWRCERCGRRRQARNLSVQVYYDHHFVFCTETEYGRSPEFPFGYANVCKGTAL